MKEIIQKQGYRHNGINRYRMTTNHIPSLDEIANAQNELGYHPAGYGGPNNIKTRDIGNNTFETVWESFASCD
jgi:hypothetical protein